MAAVQILLLGNDPGDQQWSVLNYGQQLQRTLSTSSLRNASCDVSLLAPDTRTAGRWLRQRRPGRSLAMYWSRYMLYPGLIRAKQAAIYHILDQGNSWLIHYLDPARTVITCHDLIPLVLSHRNNSTWPWLSRAAYRHGVSGLSRAAAILADSHSTRQDLITYLRCSSDRIHVVPLGLDPGFRPPADSEAALAARTALQLPAGILLLHVGQNAFYKNLEGIIRGLKTLLDRKESVWLIRAGAPLRQSQRRLAGRLGVVDRIVELGYLPHEKLRRLYHAADLFVFPSWYEGLGLPPLEAMASGLPVIVSDRGALPETAGGAALTVDPDAPIQLADAVQRLMRDAALRAELRQRGLARAGQFRWEITAQKTLEVYRLLSG